MRTNVSGDGGRFWGCRLLSVRGCRVARGTFLITVLRSIAYENQGKINKRKRKKEKE